MEFESASREGAHPDSLMLFVACGYFLVGDLAIVGVSFIGAAWGVSESSLGASTAAFVRSTRFGEAFDI